MRLQNYYILLYFFQIVLNSFNLRCLLVCLLVFVLMSICIGHCVIAFKFYTPVGLSNYLLSENITLSQETYTVHKLLAVPLMPPVLSSAAYRLPQDGFQLLHIPVAQRRAQPANRTNLYNYCKASWYTISHITSPLNRKLQAANRSFVGAKIEPPKPVKLAAKCRTMEYMSPPGPVTALASFPGSGNTWVRHLLQQATGKCYPLITRALHFS